MIGRLNHVAIAVPDLDAATALVEGELLPEMRAVHPEAAIETEVIGVPLRIRPTSPAMTPRRKPNRRSGNATTASQ